MDIQPGLTFDVSQQVTPERTAAALGSGLVPAFATPALVALIESAAYNAVRPFLADGQTTVGTEVNIQHIAATPPGMTVRAHAELVRVDGRRLFFNVEAWDEAEKIGEGTHTRVVVDGDRFQARLDAKRVLPH